MLEIDINGLNDDERKIVQQDGDTNAPATDGKLAVGLKPRYKTSNNCLSFKHCTMAAAAAATVFDAELITPPQLLLIALLRSVTKFPVGPRTTSVAAISLILLFSSCNQHIKIIQMQPDGVFNAIHFRSTKVQHALKRNSNPRTLVRNRRQKGQTHGGGRSTKHDPSNQQQRGVQRENFTIT
uniref:Uncharacterized protein n=1 Tax=Glossina austeni TaxID=7395 RepID=A0A1A9VML6_GLOAU